MSIYNILYHIYISICFCSADVKEKGKPLHALFTVTVVTVSLSSMAREYHPIRFDANVQVLFMNTYKCNWYQSLYCDTAQEKCHKVVKRKTHRATVYLGRHFIQVSLSWVLGDDHGK